MKTNHIKSRMIWFAIALLVALGSTGVAQAQNWCALCADSGGCYECCRCNGGPQQACIRACGWPFAGAAAGADVLQLAPALCSAPAAVELPPAVDAPAAVEAAPAALVPTA